jgi:hypothetical protein
VAVGDQLGHDHCYISHAIVTSERSEPRRRSGASETGRVDARYGRGANAPLNLEELEKQELDRIHAQYVLPHGGFGHSQHIFAYLSLRVRVSACPAFFHDARRAPGVSRPRKG